MAQPSVTSYFATRKRNAIDEIKQTRTNKLLNQENSSGDPSDSSTADQGNASLKALAIETSALKAKIAQLKAAQDAKARVKKVAKATRAKKVKEVEQQPSIQTVISNMIPKDAGSTSIEGTIPSNAADPVELHKTPPCTPTKENAMDKVKLPELSIKEIRKKLCRSSRLAELRASIARFEEGDAKLQELQKKKSTVPDSPGLKAFKSIELEVHLSPQKVQSPEKAYLSPKKDTGARRNLLNLLSPTKNAVALPKTENKLLTTEKLALTLPYKYRSLAEMFRSIDTVCQIMYNRKETITFTKLKPAVEELIKRNLTRNTLAQIKHCFPEAFNYRQEKIRLFGTKVECWELVVEPQVDKGSMTPEALLERRRKLFQILVEKVKIYHQEFLSSLNPPMSVDPNKLTRWHPEFDIERVPDIHRADLPKPPQEDKFTTGKDVLERAKLMFNCNTRMEAALERLKKAQESGETDQATVTEAPQEKAMPESLLKGIPQALLEKVRQRQAAKALETMTRSDAKDKEVQLYSQLPELARLLRNLFVAEKRCVLQLDIVLEKLGRGIRTHLTKADIETRLKTLEKEVPGWMMFHIVRNQTYIKIAKDADLSVVQAKLEKILKTKTAL